VSLITDDIAMLKLVQYAMGIEAFVLLFRAYFLLTPISPKIIKFILGSLALCMLYDTWALLDIVTYLSTKN
jgi:hypothetical protein